jgi:organic radical activating enzyme
MYDLHKYMMKQPIKIIPKQPVINVYWKLTDFCNFKCNYCPSYLHSGKYANGKLPGFPIYSDIIIFMDKLKALAASGTHLNLQFGGGEPTLHPNFLDIIKYMSAENVHLGVTTNGSRSDEWWSEALPFLDNVTISLHPEFTKIDKVNDLAKSIVDSGTSMRFNLSCDPARWDAVLELYNNIDDYLKPMLTAKVLNYLETTKENYSYTDEQTTWIKHHGGSMASSHGFINSMIYFDDGSSENLALGKITINNWNEFKGWKCKVASQSLMIDYTGTVNAGICMAKRLGHITDFNLDTNYLVCPFNFCPCPSDIRAEKYKI